MEDMQAILQNYGLSLTFYELFGKVAKVHTDKGVFAVKRIPANEGMEFIRSLQLLFQKGYHRLVPVFPTLDGRYGVLHGHHLYYLMPWLTGNEKEGRSQRHQQMFRELARLHTLSAREIPVDQEERKQHFERMKAEWEKQEEFLEQWITRCEQEIYMSPFQLLSSLYYIQISQALQFSKEKLEEWYEASKENKTVRTVIIHGKLSPEHFLYNEDGLGYFSNFERSQTALPIRDLLPFLSRTLKTYPTKHDECLEWIMTYFAYFPLKEDEMSLFLSYLSYPGQILSTLEKYSETDVNKDEKQFVRTLQHDYWQLRNVEYIVMRILENEQAKKEKQGDNSS